MKYLIVILFVIWLVIIVPIFGLHINTGSGTHVGFITATETGGLIWKTGTAYVKTDVQSSQEDTYCVIDSAVLDQLKEASVLKEKVQINYISYLSAGIIHCNGEGAIITSVSPLV